VDFRLVYVRARYFASYTHRHLTAASGFRERFGNACQALHGYLCQEWNPPPHPAMLAVYCSRGCQRLAWPAHNK
jgi:hypothetical protein